MRADLAAPPVLAPANIAERLTFYRWQQVFKDDGQEYWEPPPGEADPGYYRWGDAYVLLVAKEGLEALP